MNRKQGVILSGVPDAKQWTGGDGDGDELQCMLSLNNLISYNKLHPPSIDQSTINHLTMPRTKTLKRKKKIKSTIHYSTMPWTKTLKWKNKNRSTIHHSTMLWTKTMKWKKKKEKKKIKVYLWLIILSKSQTVSINRLQAYWLCCC